MPNKKISELTAAGALTGAELVEVVQSGTNVKTTTQDIADLGGGGGGSVDSVTGDGVGGTATDPVLTFPVAAEVIFTPAGNVAAAQVQAAIEELDDEKIPIKVRNDVTLANGVVTIDWAAGDIQNLTISEAKVITTISNPVVGETIILIIPGTNSLTFSGLTAVIEGTYESGVTNRIYIQCLKVSGGAEYRITYDHDSSPFPFSTLTDGATVTWTVASLEAISNRLLTIGGDRTLALSGALSGYSGNVKITASGSNRSISIPAGVSHRMKGVGDTTVKTVTIPIGETYIFTWLYDGTNYDWWYID